MDADDITVNSSSPLISPEKKTLYRKRYEEGYDVDLAEISSACTGSSSSSVVTASVFLDKSKTLSADVLAKVLTLPQPSVKKKN